MDYFSATYKNEIMPSVATWMQLEVIVTKGDRSERGRQTPRAIICKWNPKYDTNEHKDETDTESRT